MKLAKYIAHSGYTSRRKAEQLILDGRVTVNGEQVTNVATRVSPDDIIAIDHEQLHITTEKVTIMINKPSGVITSRSDEHNRKTVIDLLPARYQNLNPIGRLDKNTEGLLLLTNDGDLHHRLTHPSYQKEKEYEVVVQGAMSEKDIQTLAQGVRITLDNGKVYQTKPPTIPEYLAKKNNTSLKIIITEGKKRQIRKMFDALGFPVMQLRRIRISQLQLKNLSPGSWKALSEKDLKRL